MRLLSVLLFSLSILVAADYDLLIRGGRVLDGTGNPWYVADVGVQSGRIQKVGNLAGSSATRVIDAGGKFVSPGFIDLHSHSDIGLLDPELRYNLNMVAQGITLSVLNQDGRSARWPLREQREIYGKQGLGNNVALMVGHGTVRSRVMQKSDNQPATDADIRAMQQLVEEGMRDGAFGLSTGLEYVPGRFSGPREVIELTRAVKPFDGFYISHERSEGKDPMWKYASDPARAVDLLEAVEETIRIGRETGVPVVCSHLKAKGANYWGSSHAATRLIREAREQGIEIYADQYPYETSGSDGNTVLIPQWAQGNLKGQLADLPSARRLRLDIEHEIARRGGADRIIVYEFPEAKYIEKSLAWIAADRKLSPVDAAIWIQMNGLPRPGGARMRGFSLSELDIDHIMEQEFTATCTDGGTVGLGAGGGAVHARFYGAFPRKIRRYVVERRVISLPFAIRSMTSLAAQIMGLKDRGLIREGNWADLVVFDLATIADKATFTQPHQYAEGIPYVFVNGIAVVDGGKLTKATPGKVLTR
ncbi:MAG: D-aminoacylase [Acidobacteria bacterium]|nr:D-aminoacylase [Acidobacteriota bacterium]